MKPVFRHRIVPVEINIGNSAKFECETEDAPNVSFRWFKDGNPIKEGEKYRIISRFSSSCLELLTPTKEDGGEYACRATNQHGSDQCSAFLSVTGKSSSFLLLVQAGSAVAVDFPTGLIFCSLLDLRVSSSFFLGFVFVCFAGFIGGKLITNVCLFF